MLGLFKKKKKGNSEEDSENTENSEEEQKKDKKGKKEESVEENKSSPVPEKKSESSSGSSSLEIVKLSTEIDKLKAGQEAFAEVRKSFTERFNRTSEQIGELRAMILDRDRTIQEIELKSMKASDLVQSVEPEKLMTEVQKQDVKIEALKANLEGNEAIMAKIMDQLKETRRKIEFFRGVEEIIKLSEEVKKELIEIKKVEGEININTDKIQTIYSEMRKRLQDLDTFNSQMQEFKVDINQNSKDVDFLKTKVGDLATKDELEKFVSKVQNYIEELKEFKKRSSLSKDLDQLKILLDSVK